VRVAALIAGLLVAAAPASAQEYLIGGFNPGEWKIGHQTADRNQRVTEFIRPGEKIDSWTELLTAQLLRKSAYPASVDDMVAASHQKLASRCPQATINVIARQAPSATEESGMLFEWTVKNCPPDADQHDMARTAPGHGISHHLRAHHRSRGLLAKL